MFAYGYDLSTLPGESSERMYHPVHTRIINLFQQMIPMGEKRHFRRVGKNCIYPNARQL
jgi:hypothetical protein